MNRLAVAVLFVLIAAGSAALPSAQAQRPPVPPRDFAGATAVGQPPDVETIPLHGPNDSDRARSGAGGDSAKRIVMSLALVLGAFFLVAWIGRKRNQDEGLLPAEAVEVLGRIAIGPRESARLLRVGSKLVLVADSPHGLSPLTEVEDPEEVRRLVEWCDTMRGGPSNRGRPGTHDGGRAA